MLYRIVRPVATIAFKVFFKHIHINGLEYIPMRGPALIGANHPTAFIEPCILACLQPRILNFIVRGDIFKKPFYIKLLKSLHLIPIFRFRDGFTSLKNNQETFKYVNEVLRDQKAIFILPEGRTIQEKRLRPLQKGTGRMAFGAFEEYGVDNTLIVPIGVTYEQANSWRKDIIISCGKPISLKKHIDTYKENPNLAIQEVTDKLANRMSQLMVIIPEKDNDEIVDLICKIYQNDTYRSSWPILIKNDHKLKKEQLISESFSMLSTKEQDHLKQAGREYNKLLKEYKIEDFSVSKKIPNLFQMILIIALGVIMFIPGFVFNALPVFISKTIATKKVYVKEFYSPVLLALCMFLTMVWYLIFGTIAIYLYGWMGLLIMLGLFISGYISILFLETMSYLIRKIKFKLLNSLKKNKIKLIREELKFLNS